MDYPKRVKQHKSESDSFAILIYKLKNLGIFRNMTENDYGIDFEIECVEGERLTGNFIKVQVKSAKDIKITKKNIPTVRGIKQSTLNYWTELSYKTHVLVFAVDLTTEYIYYTDPIFWQATKLLDKGNSTKKIKFNKRFDETLIKSKNKKIKNEAIENLTEFFISLSFQKPRLEEVLYAHRTALRNISDFYELYIDCFHYDYHCDFNKPEVLQHFFEISKILLYEEWLYKKELTEDERNAFNYYYWLRKDKSGLTNLIVQTPMKLIFPAFIEKLKIMKKDVLEGKYYWLYRNITYLKLVYDTDFPNKTDHDSIWNYDIFKKKVSYFDDFINKIL